MPQHPMSGPDPSKPCQTRLACYARSPTTPVLKPISPIWRRVSKPKAEADYRRTLRNLALEIVLNEIVEQTCLATRRNRCRGGVAARRRNGVPRFERDDRPRTGRAARHDIRTLRRVRQDSPETQRCDDVLVDPRVDMEASKRLGVRSVIVMPLINRDELLGVFELFSSEAYAFGDCDEGTLEVLAGRILNALQRAAQVPGPPIENA